MRKRLFRLEYKKKDEPFFRDYSIYDAEVLAVAMAGELKRIGKVKETRIIDITPKYDTPKY
jgi:hypothetical protein